MIENILFFVFVWISFLSAVRLTDFPITAKKLHLRNVDRYFTSPIFANGSQGSEFACFLRSGSEKHENIMRNTKTELVDMRMALPYLRNKTILFMGDSLMRNQFSALVAQIWEADETCLHYDGSNESFPGYLKPRTVHTARRSSALHCFKYNLQVQYLFSTTLLDLSNENLMQLSAETKVFKSWSELMKGQHDWRVPDTVVLSTGHYWGQYSYKMGTLLLHF